MTTKAKTALGKILPESDISYEDMCSLAIRKAKEHKLSVDYLVLLRREIHGVAACSDGGEKVAVIVQDLVDSCSGNVMAVLPAMFELRVARKEVQVILQVHLLITSWIQLPLQTSCDSWRILLPASKASTR